MKDGSWVVKHPFLVAVILFLAVLLIFGAGSLVSHPGCSGSSDRQGSATVSDTITDGKHDPVEAYEVDEMKHLLADAINRMPDRERLVLTLYYYEGLTLAEIGKLLNVTESRVCQIHTKSILQLRGRLSEPERERT